jgi:Fe-S-cluster containining protein
MLMKNITNEKNCFKCRLCCLLSKKEKDLAPYFSKIEMELVDKDCIKRNNAGLFQARMLKSKLKVGYYRCSFLDEVTHKCSIYNKRPIDCMTWPFIVGWDKEKKDVYLWIANGEYCPAVKDKKMAEIKKVENNTIKFLEDKNFFKEIKNKERLIWPYADYQIKLKKITNLIN